MGWFSKKEPKPDPEKRGKKPSEGLTDQMRAADALLEKFLPGANQTGSIAEFYADEDSTDEQKDAFIDALLELYEVQEGIPFLSAAGTKPTDIGDAQSAIENAIYFLGRSQKYFTATEEQIKANSRKRERSRLTPEQSEANRAEQAIDLLYANLLTHINPNRPLVDQMNTYIDSVPMRNAPQSLYTYLRAQDEPDLRSRLKDHIVVRLMSDQAIKKLNKKQA